MSITKIVIGTLVSISTAATLVISFIILPYDALNVVMGVSSLVTLSWGIALIISGVRDRKSTNTFGRTYGRRN